MLSLSIRRAKPRLPPLSRLDRSASEQLRQSVVKVNGQTKTRRKKKRGRIGHSTVEGARVAVTSATTPVQFGHRLLSAPHKSQERLVVCLI